MATETEQRTSVDEPKPVPPRRKRRWFQFGISSLLLLTFVVACFLGLASYGRKYERKNAVLELIKALGGEYEARAKYPQWVDRLMGAESLEVRRISFRDRGLCIELDNFDGNLAWLAEFPELVELQLRHCPGRIKRAGLDRIAELHNLKALSLRISPPSPVDPEYGKAFDLARAAATITPETWPAFRHVETLELEIRNYDEPLVVQGFPNLLKLELTYEDAAPSLIVEDLPRLEALYFDMEDVLVGGMEMRNVPRLKSWSGHTREKLEVRSAVQSAH